MFLVSLSGEGRGGLGSWSQVDVLAFPCSLVFEFDRVEGGWGMLHSSLLTACSRDPRTAAGGGEWAPHFGQAQPGWERGIPDLGVSSKGPIPTPTNSSDCGDSLPLGVSLLPSEMHGLGAIALTLIPCQ